MAYATPADWAAWTGKDVPTGDDLLALQRRLESASRKVARLTRAAIYRTDALGAPIDAGVADALREATLEQDAYSSQIDPDGFGLGLEAVTVGPVTLSGVGGTNTGAANPNAPAALETLAAAGLITAAVGY